MVARDGRVSHAAAAHLRRSTARMSPPRHRRCRSATQGLVFFLCSALSRTQPVTPRNPPNCLDESTAPVCASTITFVCVFFLLGMISMAYSVRPLVTFISPEPICPGTAQSAITFAESGEIIVDALYLSVLILAAWAA